MENGTTTTTDAHVDQLQQTAPALQDNQQQVQTQAVNPAANTTPQLPPTKAKVMFEQVILFELEPEEARDTEYLRKLLEPHYSAATDAKFEYKQEGDWLIVTMIKQNPPKG